MDKLLYNIPSYKDACGTGFVTNISGEKSHAILQRAIEAVCNLTHRGAVSADGKSGDGAGILTQIPHKIFHKFLADAGVRARPDRGLAVGMIFLPGHKRRTGHTVPCRQIVEQTCKEAGFDILAWRDVPVNNSVLGQKARDESPDIKQILLAAPAGLRGEVFERNLYVARKEIQHKATQAGFDSFHVASLSHRTIVYKGLFIAPQLQQFYGDLTDPDFETALAVFHQRFSTNTVPTWDLAQPFCLLAHNGEINTIRGNENWMRAWEAEFGSALSNKELEKILPVLPRDASDSAKLDCAAELLLRTGRSILHSLVMLIPEAYERANLNDDLSAFYEYHETIMEPWDGPAAVVFTDGVVVGAKLDRNGLRPARYFVTEDGLVVLASEAGVVDVPQESIVEKGRLGPGEIIAVDVAQRRLLKDTEIKSALSRAHPYRQWLDRNKLEAPRLVAEKGYASEPDFVAAQRKAQIAFGYGKEDIDRILQPMSMTSKTAMGSMGDDTPLSLFSEQPQTLFSYFKQKFAQVTNPPIDPIRERMVMSLRTQVGHRGSILEDVETHARFISLPSPILSTEQFEWLKTQPETPFKATTLAAVFPVLAGTSGLRQALNSLFDAATQAVDSGHAILILSDRSANETHAAIPVLLALSSLHHYLIRTGRRMRVSLICETGQARDEHHMACLLGFGATAIYPYLAYETIAQQVALKRFRSIAAEDAIRNYRKSLDSGLLKIMAKMGISTVSSYRGAQIFECIGLEKDLIDFYFTGTEARIGGIGLEAIAEDVLRLHQAAHCEADTLPDYGIYRYRKNGESHAYNPEMMRPLHAAVRRGDHEDAYRIFSDVVNNRRPVKLRDVIDIKSDRSPVDIRDVEPVESIVKTFCTAAMSLGALSHEAHIALAIGMNRLGAKSNSGEGGEDAARFFPDEQEGVFDNDLFDMKGGDSCNSTIKQIASGRFGVTPAYLQSASEIEIKMAQGAKPGEGGQLPGFKVTREIARIRYTVPGTALISPPPHHDIYSIEDIAQLIYDLKSANPRVKVSVKLVASAGVGTIAAGVIKAGADGIHISGHDGGTGASPLSSIRNTGVPWEIGLAEAQRVLQDNHLRDKVYLRVDGGLKTGRDVIIAALLGAQEFGFGTAALVAVGCVMARQCHLNTCPVGVATQNEELRARFKGHPDHVVNYMLYVANEVRQLLAKLGYCCIKDLCGRAADLLCEKETARLPKAHSVNIASLILQKNKPQSLHVAATRAKQAGSPVHPDDWLLPGLNAAIAKRTNYKIRTEIKNTDRAAGTRLAGEIARRFGNAGLTETSVEIHYEGTAGQSFGAFLVPGVHLLLEGEANDYVGKGMAGGRISIYPPKNSQLVSHRSTIIGNTVMYGATGGSLFAAGQAGERFCVRNSGGMAVVEGVGDHACEYMTGGTVVILGRVGRNFGAGMTGGAAFVLDVDRSLSVKCNRKTVAIERLARQEDLALVHKICRQHRDATGSVRAGKILQDWEICRHLFRKVRPRVGTEPDSQ